MRQKTIVKFVIFLLLIGLLIFSIKYFNLEYKLTTENLRTTVSSAGIFGPLVFIILYIITGIFFLPGSIFSIASGAIFGVVAGTIYTVIGASIGAVLGFLISRYFMRSFFEEMVARKYKKIREYDKKLERNGFITVLFFRLIPLFPFNGLNFALGITKVRLRDYFIATLIGIIPGSLLFAYLGDSIVEMNYINIIISIVLIILLALSLNIYRNYKKGKIVN